MFEYPPSYMLACAQFRIVDFDITVDVIFAMLCFVFSAGFASGNEASEEQSGGAGGREVPV